MIGDLTDPELALCRKSKEKALEFKRKGNERFSKGDYAKALSFYSQVGHSFTYLVWFNMFSIYLRSSSVNHYSSLNGYDCQLFRRYYIRIALSTLVQYFAEIGRNNNGLIEAILTQNYSLLKPQNFRMKFIPLVLCSFLGCDCLSFKLLTHVNN